MPWAPLGIHKLKPHVPFSRGLAFLMRVLYRVSTAGLSKGPHITRFAMYQRLAQFSGLARPEHRVLSVGRSMCLAQLLGYAPAQVKDTSYPECDLLDLAFDDCSFDAVVADQVLEHVAGNPERAVAESFRVVRPAGFVVHTTCFVNPLHGAPQDFWRFSPEGLRLLVPSGASVLECAGWGNRAVWLFDLFRIRYEGIPHARWHPAHWAATYNRAEWPVSTWIIAQKALEG